MNVISTEAARFYRAAQWRDPCISSLLFFRWLSGWRRKAVQAADLWMGQGLF
jgi:hypothetical protein